MSREPRGGGSDPSPMSIDDPSREAFAVASDGAGADGSRSPAIDGSEVCSWCRGPMPVRSLTARARRRDAETCSKRCRQARHRFKVERARDLEGDRPMSFAYADPPYPGMAWRYYRGEEVDHPALIRRLLEEFPDGWALSTSSEALPRVLRMIPEDAVPDIRVASWAKSARPNKRARRPTSTWEPVILYRGRPLPPGHDVRDALLWGGRQHSHPDALVGMKPAPFCEWLFNLLGARRGDRLADIFPGSGAVSRAWAIFVSTGQSRLDPRTPSFRDLVGNGIFTREQVEVALAELAEERE